MNTTVNGHFRDDDQILFRLVTDTERMIIREPYVELHIGDVTFYPAPDRLRQIIDVATQAADALRLAIVERWAEEHNAAGAPFGPGRCDACGEHAEWVYPTRIDGPDVIDCCARCADVDDELLLPTVLRLTEDETPDDRRAELHDAGIDAEPVAS